MSKNFWMNGLVPATFTPMHADGSLNLDLVLPMVERLLAFKVMSMFVCGTTGECASLSTAERKATLEAFITAAAGRIPVIAHVGHTAIADSRDLAAHAESSGAAAISATPPFYFKPASVSVLVDCMAAIAAAAPSLPFYYYHIPHFTGVALEMEDFLHEAADLLRHVGAVLSACSTTSKSIRSRRPAVRAAANSGENSGCGWIEIASVPQARPANGVKPLASQTRASGGFSTT